jgi:hypothetical protein
VCSREGGGVEQMRCTCGASARAGGLVRERKVVRGPARGRMENGAGPIEHLLIRFKPKFQTHRI